MPSSERSTASTSRSSLPVGIFSGEVLSAGPAGAADQTLLARCCTALSKLLTDDVFDEQRWLRIAAQSLLTLESKHQLIASALSIRTTDGAGDLCIHLVETSLEARKSAPPLARLMHNLEFQCASAGPLAQFPDESHAITIRRADLISDQNWPQSPYQQKRQSLGAFDFVRTYAPCGVLGAPQWLILQLDGADPHWRPPVSLAAMLHHVGAGIGDGYRSIFARRNRLREKLLAPLNEMQRQVVPLLAEGQRERQIAESLGRSHHTVHEHVKSIYQHWGINSRRAVRDVWHGRTSVLQPSRLDQLQIEPALR